ncbi:MAG: hypothetical protein M0R30_08895 [Methanoregula sp.]|jgi:hypothetical protein|nr:hypothetical protein [Methanoregula sp.]
MEPSERTIVYGLVGACICGIIIVGAFLIFAGGMFSSSSGFSELYFENHQTLPAIINENDPVNFSFTVVSHNKENTDYFYEVFAGNQIIRSGSFILPQTDSSEERLQLNLNKTSIFIEGIRFRSTLIPLNELQNTQTQITEYEGTGLIQSDNENDSHILKDPSKIYYPVQLPENDETITLAFDPSINERFRKSTTRKIKIGDMNTIKIDDKATEIHGYRPSNVGYDTSETELTVSNDRGTISETENKTTIQYRYAFEKVSVNLSASPVSNPDKTSYYEIHFWVFAKDPSQQ